MSSRSLTGSVSFALLVVVAAAGVFATAGSARAPGKNGPIAFRRYFRCARAPRIFDAHQSVRIAVQVEPVHSVTREGSGLKL
jgi:hypothetical protein